MEEGDIVWATVDRIMGTVVFVKIDNDGEGTIIESEITSGRVKNIRDFVVPKKRIVCKIIRMQGNRIDLSMRRVSAKEQKEAKDAEGKEKSYKGILRGVLGEKANSVIEQISKEKKVYELMDEAKENPKVLEKFLSKDELKKIIEILQSQKKKKAEVKQEIKLSTTKPNGIQLIKELLKGLNVKYLAAGKYVITSEAGDLKSADNQLRKTLEEMEKKARKLEVEYSVK